MVRFVALSRKAENKGWGAHRTLEFEVRCRKLFPNKACVQIRKKTRFCEVGMVQRFWICEIKINERKNVAESNFFAYNTI